MPHSSSSKKCTTIFKYSEKKVICVKSGKKVEQ